jgi:3-deoxy-manno-octulosonate cytidylyltransferase (CMP-KDO synthetase)
MTHRVLGVIPARLESKRFPHKVLRPILGDPMVVWVYRRARGAKGLDDLLVATDSEEVAECCGRHGVPAVMTSRHHHSGTDRLGEVMERRPAEIYVNIQGDEPTVTAQHIERLLEPFRETPEIPVATLKVAISEAEARDPNKVKVVCDANGRALYFSRAMIPYSREAAANVRYYKHLGLYAYRAAALRTFLALPPSPLEEAEKLEQLRFLENGIPIAVREAAEDTIAVDTEEDVARVEARLRRERRGAEGAVGPSRTG